MARFLCGILPLQVETGRFSNVKKELRLCKVCFGDAVEDELHFFLHCPKLEDAREIHVKPFLNTNVECSTMSDHEKLNWLIAEGQMKEFGRILAIMYDARQEIMYKQKT